MDCRFDEGTSRFYQKFSAAATVIFKELFEHGENEGLILAKIERSDTRPGSSRVKVIRSGQQQAAVMRSKVKVII